MNPKPLTFKDFPHFKPNLTPKQVIQKGSFGGTYFRDIKSSVTNKKYKDSWKEFPKSWFTGKVVNKKFDNYSKQDNKYNVKVGTTLEFWESKDWIREQDPYGWFQWYCRFYKGRRSDDDERQIKRYNNMRRFKGPLIKKIKSTHGSSYNDETISPRIRQTLLHWAYELTEIDYNHHT